MQHDLPTPPGYYSVTYRRIHIFSLYSYCVRRETELYYLQSRYYDPELGRFINADGQISSPGEDILGNNMYAYCFNNPVNMTDSTGGWPRIVAFVAAVVVTIVAANAAKNAAIDSLKNVNPAEKKAAKKDPLGAIKGNEAKDIANEYQKKLYPNTYQFDANQANAFKHAMWNAVMTDKIGEKRAKKFANAHEEPYLASQPDLCEMDLHNNELGRQIASKYAGQGYDVFAEKIQEAINEGNAYVIRWDEGN